MTNREFLAAGLGAGLAWSTGAAGTRRSLSEARAKLALVKSPEYLASLVGTIGADPMCH